MGVVILGGSRRLSHVQLPCHAACVWPGSTMCVCSKASSGGTACTGRTLTACTVPRRGCEHAKAPTVICARCPEPASGLRHCSVWLWLAHRAGPGEWSNPAARGRPLVSQRGETLAETGRGRMTRKGKDGLGSAGQGSQQAKQASKQRPGCG